MTDLEDRIKNPRFNNWVKSALTLDFARDAVKEFVEKEIKICHRSLIQSITGACSSCDFRTCDKCKNQTCTNEILKKDIKHAHDKSTPTFDNTNPKDCWSNPWEFAKCFMPQNAYAKVKDADETDLPGLISVIVNNLDLRKIILDKDTPFIKVKQVRNEIMHNPRFAVDDETFKTYTEAIRNMLFCIDRTVKVKSALTRIDELSNGSISITMKDIAHVINEAIASLQQLSNEIKDAIPDMLKLSHRFTQEIENETKKGVKSLKIKVNDGVIVLEQKTEEGVRILDDATKHGRGDIKKEATDATVQLSVKRQEGVDAIASQANEKASQFQNLSEERTVALKKAAEKETEALRHEGNLVTEELKNKVKQESNAIDVKIEGLLQDLNKKLERDENSQNPDEIHQTTYARVSTLTECFESLHKEKKMLRNFIDDIKPQPDHDTHTDFEKRLMELSGTVRELKSRQRKVCPFDNLDVGLESEKIYSITGMTKVSAEFLVVVDNLNSRVKLINVRSNNIISFVNIDNPFDITSVNHNVLVVSDREALQFLYLKDDKLIVAHKRLEFQDWCGGVDYTDVDNSFAVSFDDVKKIGIIKMDGTILRMIELQQVGKWTSKQVYLKLSQDGRSIYVVNRMLQKCMCIDSEDGSLLYSYEPTTLEGPSGIAVDKVGNVYIAGDESNNIHMFSPDGSLVSICLDKSNGIEQPVAIAYCDQEHALYVSHSGYGKVVSICPILLLSQTTTLVTFPSSHLDRYIYKMFHK